jgi:hypothetical protein
LNASLPPFTSPPFSLPASVVDGYCLVNFFSQSPVAKSLPIPLECNYFALVLLQRMFSKLKRLRSKSCKVQLVLELQELKIFVERPDLTLICIELRRGSKSISSSSKICRDDGSRSVKFDEQLLLLMTLYKDTNGIYMEKVGKIILNGHSNITNSSVSVGSSELKLNVIASNFEHQKLDLILLDETGQIVASMSAVSSSKFLGSGDLDDDASSIMSGGSGISSKSPSRLRDVRYGSVYSKDHAGN